MKNKEKISDELSLISQNVQIKGNVSGEGNFRIEGKVEGNIEIKGNLFLGDQSKIIGNIKVNNLTSNGFIEGKINVDEKLVLEKKSKVMGDINTKILIVEEGAEINGKCIMGTPSIKSSKDEN